MLKTVGAVYIYIYIVRFNKKEKTNIDNKKWEKFIFPIFCYLENN